MRSGRLLITTNMIRVAEQYGEKVIFVAQTKEEIIAN
jgi:hypothetical protein